VLPTVQADIYCRAISLPESVERRVQVLWLAHTHHLLEQALDSFGKRGDGADGMEVGLIHEPKERLRATVVSGTLGHTKIGSISSKHDVVICTLQTAVRAY